MEANIKYDFSAVVWKYGTEGGWYFVSLPKDIAKEIRENLKWQEEGWGRMKAIAQIKDFKWETAIWFDTKLATYILPLKAEVRKKNSVEINQELSLTIFI